MSRVDFKRGVLQSWEVGGKNERSVVGDILFCRGSVFKRPETWDSREEKALPSFVLLTLSLSRPSLLNVIYCRSSLLLLWSCRLLSSSFSSPWLSFPLNSFYFPPAHIKTLAVDHLNTPVNTCVCTELALYLLMPCDMYMDSWVTTEKNVLRSSD